MTFWLVFLEFWDVILSIQAQKSRFQYDGTVSDTFLPGGLGNMLTLVAIPYVRLYYGPEFSLLQLNSVVLILHMSLADLLYCAVGFPHFIQVLSNPQANFVGTFFLNRKLAGTFEQVSYKLEPSG